MEMPHIGTHCAEPTCRQLDFLPFACNLCKKEFCVDHHKYEAHKCSESYRADVQVPICPLCDQPVPSRPGQPPDLAVNEHLENNCKTKNKKIYTNRCSASGCKIREMVPVQCDSCHLNYCLRHRHPQDHQCQPAAASKSQALAAAQARQAGTKNNKKSSGGGMRGDIQRFFSTSSSPPTPTGHSPVPQQPRQPSIAAIQGGMSEDEALARAMAASVQVSGGEGGKPAQRRDEASQGNRGPGSGSGAGQNSEDEDTQLARAIAASLEETQRPSNSNGSSNSCSLS